MISTIASVLRVASSKIRQLHKKVTRSPHWAALEREVVRERGSCAACGVKSGLQVHHRKPFHLHPELELDKENLIVLCMTVNGKECHLRIGHGGNFKTYNPFVTTDAAECLELPGRFDDIVVRAKKARLAA